MKERPILFSAPMVRAILDGKKTQTRRVCKNHVRSNGTWVKHMGNFDCENYFLPPDALLMDYRKGGFELTTSSVEGWSDACKFGQPGDQLWVREAWRCFGGREYEYQQEKSSIIYRCDVNPLDDVAEWLPSISMPRWASRINLLIKSIRVERLQDISEADAKAEGVEPFFTQHQSIAHDQRLTSGELASDGEHRASFAVLWDEINGKCRVGDLFSRHTWQENPWVWVVEFEVVK